MTKTLKEGEKKRLKKEAALPANINFPYNREFLSIAIIKSNSIFRQSFFEKLNLYHASVMNSKIQ